MSTPPVLAILCHDNDITHAETLHQHLKFSENNGRMAIWHPGLISAGAHKLNEQEKHLSSASVVVVLISPDLMASAALERRAKALFQEKPASTVLPLKVRYTTTIGGNFHEGIQDLTILTSDKEKAWADAAQAVLTTWERLTAPSQPTPTPTPAPIPQPSPQPISTPTPVKAPELTWLHLTDLHRRGVSDNRYWPAIRNALWDELQEPPVEDLKSLGLILFTGDLAFSARKEEYEEVKTFLDQLWERVGRKIPIIAVPGNHDTRWPEKKSLAAYNWLRHYDEDTYRDQREALWGKDDDYGDRSRIIDLYENYISFFDQHLLPTLEGHGRVIQGRLPGDVLASLDLGGFHLGVMGLNSSWRQFTSGNFEKKITVANEQCNALIEPFGGKHAFRDKHHLRLLLQHHPPHWLDATSATTWSGIIEPHCDLTLFGHMHSSEVENRQYNGHAATTRIQGRSLFGVEDWGKKTEDRLFGFGWGHARVQGDHTHVRLWSRKLVEAGQWSFKHPEDMGYKEGVGQKLPPIEVGRRVPR